MEATGVDPAGDEYSTSKPTKFRFKTKRARSEKDHDTEHRNSEKRHPDSAFRESLFDALADDEGAAYWEGVYGQPMHIYSNTKEGPKGELEQMTEEEYAAYVRARMYEKSHEHIEEERVRMEQERRRRKKAEKAREQTSQMEEEREDFQARVEASLKKGEARKKAKETKESWTTYNKRWEELKANADQEKSGKVAIRNVIPWPIRSGQWKDVEKDAIEQFLLNAPVAEDGLSTLLKLERVKWHPDKIQQRFGEGGIDAETMQLVTAVFQVVDRMWNDLRKKSNG
ncbi:uncharacterized protein BDZ99DRAFT_394182 [Mytilinidion resinicola]|uniref:Uncharacterized protein n=1 Tax=Mytilinidion resinicola TaxID=574789 RepID=A0A6A6YBK2_9PEZI|nr:uncharacterized protein BDZ99DRAFT_394182 [Mytilinidion resinicola]KAF2806191.1 hypothetical protein BDZ99DRAFT_394182 [Mytilinidion resinicola]